MNLSFAHLPGLPKAQRAAMAASLLCITFAASIAHAQSAVPLQEFQAAQQAVAKAADADADQYSPEWIGKARDSLAQAQAAVGDRKQRKQAPQLVQRAQVEAELALVQSQATVAIAQLAQARDDAARLKRELDTPLPPLAPPPPPATTALPAGASQTEGTP